MCQSFGSYLTVSNLRIIVVLHNGHVDKLLSCEFGEFGSNQQSCLSLYCIDNEW